ncbi:MAG: CGNR zinc finger domain-containing protein [Thermoanaerobaculia bacterium]
MKVQDKKRPVGRHPSHPAPGNLRIIQDFLNTVEHRTGGDVLKDPAAVSAWLSSRDLLPPDTPLDQAAWRSAIELREGLRELVGGNPTSALAERLNRAAGTVRPRLRFEADGSLRLITVDGGWPAAAGGMLLAVFEAKLAGRWSRLKVCREDSCRRLFYDAAKNRLGKWCNVRRCGVPLHSKTYRRRQARRDRR